MRKGKNKLTLTTAFRNGSSEKKELLTKIVNEKRIISVGSRDGLYGCTRRNLYGKCS